MHVAMVNGQKQVLKYLILFNLHYLPPMPPHQYQAIGNFVMNEARQHMTLEQQGNISLTATTLPDGNLAVVDDNKNVIYKQPITHAFIAAANVYQRKINQQAVQDIGNQGVSDMLNNESMTPGVAVGSSGEQR